LRLAAYLAGIAIVGISRAIGGVRQAIGGGGA
jgi:hypothetical protein